jgi:hypothetical protein
MRRVKAAIGAWNQQEIMGAGGGSAAVQTAIRPLWTAKKIAEISRVIAPVERGVTVLSISKG